ncbi:MAG: hypothetical protein HS103_09105 [Anaerolineales bacterium]|nr:hypothetical protein [Anaerolineales bacterium]
MPSIILCRAETVERTAKIAHHVFSAAGFAPYDPFPGGTGTPIQMKEFVRLFAAPPLAGWVRLIGEITAELATPLLVALSEQGDPRDALWLRFNGEHAALDAYQGGKPASLTAFLKAGVGEDALAASLAQAPEGGRKRRGRETPPADLPDDLADFAKTHQVNPSQAAGFIERFAGGVFGRLDKQSGGAAGGMRGEAAAMLGGGGWSGLGGGRLLAAAALLMIPAGWETPTFEVLRDAYQVGRRLRRSPNADLMPDERAALNALPDALSFLPLYVGR